MKRYRLAEICRDQKGFTLVELLIVTAIAMMVAAVVTMSIFQIFDISARNSAHMRAIKEVENAGHWMTRDAEMAQYLNGNLFSDYTTTESGTFSSSPFLNMSWTYSYDNVITSYEVVYHIAGDKMYRRLSQYDADSNPMATSTSLLIENINPELTLSTWQLEPIEKTFTFQVSVLVPGMRAYTGGGSFSVMARSSPTGAP